MIDDFKILNTHNQTFLGEITSTRCLLETQIHILFIPKGGYS
jgi:hypothetical protein